MDSPYDINNLVIVTLDQSISSIPLRSKYEEQRELHMEWHVEMEFFNSNAIVIPLEYCVSPNNSIWSKRMEPNWYFVNDASLRKPQPSEEQPNKKRKTCVNEMDLLSEFPVELRGNKKFMMDRVRDNGMYLYYAHPDLLRDEELVLEAIRNNGESFKYASYTLQKDENFLRKALSISGDSFCFLYREFRERMDLFELAIKTSGKPFTRAEGVIRSSLYHALQCIDKHWPAINNFDKKSPNYPSVIQSIIEKGIPDDKLFNSNLISDRDMLLNYLEMKSNKAFLMAKEEITLDKQIIEKVLDNNLITAKYFTEKQLKVIINNAELVKKIIKHPEIFIDKDKAKRIIDYSTKENVRLLIKKYPQYCSFLNISHTSIIDPFISRYFSFREQFNNLSYFGQRFEQTKIEFENMGFLFHMGDVNFENLKKRFEISHPGLVIPWHRFTSLSPRPSAYDIFTIQSLCHQLNKEQNSD